LDADLHMLLVFAPVVALLGGGRCQSRSHPARVDRRRRGGHAVAWRSLFSSGGRCRPIDVVRGLRRAIRDLPGVLPGDDTLPNGPAALQSDAAGLTTYGPMFGGSVRRPEPYSHRLGANAASEPTRLSSFQGASPKLAVMMEGNRNDTPVLCARWPPLMPNG